MEPDLAHAGSLEGCLKALEQLRAVERLARLRVLEDEVLVGLLSRGTRSDDGERFAERVLSAAITCRLRRRSLFAYLSELLAAHNRGDPFPALT